jgi:hypothetical protein
MQSIAVNLATLAVAVLYYLWRDYHQKMEQRRLRLLRQRVTYLLWVMAERIKDSDSGLSAT